MGDIEKATGISLDSKTGMGINTMFDPLDLFGTRAGAAADKQLSIAEQAANESIINAQNRYRKTTALQKPYMDYGKSGFAGESADFGAQFYDDWGQGKEAVDSNLASRGLYDSSYAKDKLGELAQGLGEQEMARQHQRKLDALKIGQLASGTAGSSGSQYAGNAANALTSQGSNVQGIMQNYGQQRQASMTSGGNALTNLGAYLDN